MNIRALVVFTVLYSSCIFGQSGWKWQNPLPQGNVLNAVRFSSAAVGITVGEVGTIQRTTDGGVSWSGVETNFTTNLNAVWTFSDQHALIIGDAGIIVTTTDGGTTWNTPGSGTTKNLYAVHFTDVNTGVIVGDQGIFLRTTNGGNSWNQTTPFTGAQ